jgi:hypothetical protein
MRSTTSIAVGIFSYLFFHQVPSSAAEPKNNGHAALPNNSLLTNNSSANTAELQWHHCGNSELLGKAE